MGLFSKGPSVTLNVGGMTCSHCVMSVTKALEELEGVKKAKVSLGKKEAKITLKTEGSASTDDMLAAVKAAGFEASI